MRFPTSSLLLAVLVLPTVSGCSSVQKVTSGGSVTRTLAMSDLNSQFASFQRTPEYNFLGEAVEYRQIGVPEYDQMFARAAYIKGTVQVLTAVAGRFQEGRLSLDTEQDYLFLRAVAGFGVQTLPTLLQEGPALLAQIASLRPHQDVPLHKVPAALSGLNQMRSNLTGMDAGGLGQLLDTVTSIQCQVGEAARASETGVVPAYSSC